MDFNLKEIALAIDGQAVDGFGDGDVISLEPREDLTTLTIGADGKGIFNTKNDKSAEITISLLYGSPANVRLQALIDTTVSISVYDPRGGYDGFAAKCRVMKRPARTYSNEAASVEWKFLTDNLDDKHGEQT